MLDDLSSKLLRLIDSDSNFKFDIDCIDPVDTVDTVDGVELLVKLIGSLLLSGFESNGGINFDLNSTSFNFRSDDISAVFRSFGDCCVGVGSRACLIGCGSGAGCVGGNCSGVGGVTIIDGFTIIDGGPCVGGPCVDGTVDGWFGFCDSFGCCPSIGSGSAGLDADVGSPSGEFNCAGSGVGSADSPGPGAGDAVDSTRGEFNCAGPGAGDPGVGTPAGTGTRAGCTFDGTGPVVGSTCDRPGT